MYLIIIIALATYTSMMVSNKFRKTIAIVGTGIMLLYCIMAKAFSSEAIFQRFPVKIPILIFAPCAIYLIGLLIYSLFRSLHPRDDKDIETTSDIDETTEENKDPSKINMGLDKKNNINEKIVKPAPPPLPPPPPHLPHLLPPKPLPHRIKHPHDKDKVKPIHEEKVIKDLEAANINEDGEDV